MVQHIGSTTVDKLNIISLSCGGVANVDTAEAVPSPEMDEY